ncbi:hypothetical protein Taro_007656 [Colocasia esculenta]|uniref:Uridylate kinase n=1 Tax=Colocasia esculenta TaxID=4460 RepID=A0A843TVK1_COLES|nr:hypothetical protein [Colocasia esculenta]
MEETSMSKPTYKWRRVLLKVSGEALAGDHTENIDPKVAIVVGGRNIFRGASWAGCSGLDRSSADYIGYRIMDLSILLQKFRL